jgi:hydrocephalus-inducing protein
LYTCLANLTSKLPLHPPSTQVHWNKDHALRREVTFESNTDISLNVIEPATGRVEFVVPIKLSARAQFSRYAITPARGLHFGPVTYGTATAPRTFEVTNLGGFPFTVKLFPLGDPPAPPSMLDAEPAAEAVAQGGKSAKGVASHGTAGAAGKKPAAAASSKTSGAAATEGGAVAAQSTGANALDLGQFTFEPAEAVVQPGGRLEVGVVFRAEGAAAHAATAGISISERDFGDHPEGLPYSVAGQSCIPGEGPRPAGPGNDTYAHQ